MKILLICGSFFVNLMLAATLVLRPSLAPPAFRDFIRDHRPSATAVAPAKPPAPKPAPKLWPQLETTDLPVLVRRLQAAGFPNDVIRALISSIVDARYVARARDLTEGDASVPFWKVRPLFTNLSDKRLIELQALQRERSKALRDVLGAPELADADTSAAQHRHFGNLAADKIEMVRRIEDDYSEMSSSIRAATKGIELPADREKFALLAKEKKADLLSLMSPEEYADYEMRTSRLTSTLRERFTNFDPSEAEYRSIYQSYQAMADKYPWTPGAVMDWDTRNEAQKALTDQLRAALGDARYAEFARDMDDGYRQLTTLAQKQNLPADTADRAYALRDSVARKSAQIVADTTMSAEDKRAALLALGQNARADLAALVPGPAGEPVIKRSTWLGILEHGAGFTVTPNVPMIAVSDTGGVATYSTSTQIRPLPIQRAPIPR